MLDGNPPDAADRDLIMTAIADVNGVERIVQKLVSVYPDVNLAEAFDPSLDEFAIFAPDETPTAAAIARVSISMAAGCRPAACSIMARLPRASV